MLASNREPIIGADGKEAWQKGKNAEVKVSLQKSNPGAAGNTIINIVNRLIPFTGVPISCR